MTEEKKEDVKAEATEKAPAKKKAAPKKAAADKKADAKEKAPAKKEAKKAAPKKAKKDSGVKKVGKVVDNPALYDVIVRPVITEKASIAAEQNKVVFQISPTADKKQVKAAVEGLFGVKVNKVNTVLTKGKAKRFRGQAGQRSDVRKAIVTLAEGQSIDIAAGLK